MAESYPLKWPDGYPRTKHRKSARFDTSFATARDGLFEELRLLGARNIVVSTNRETYNKGGREVPYARQARLGEDPGVAIYFQYQDEYYTFACDRWVSLEDNIQAIRKTIEAIRGIERWGVSEMLKRTFQGFKALPEQASSPSWWSVLGVDRIASREEIERAYRCRAMETHPDRGGTASAFHQVRTAYEQAIAAQEAR